MAQGAKRKHKEVLLIFKTHLDIGFTDFSKNILNKYLTEYIPNAIRVGYELQGTKTPFVWTVGSWLVWQALKNDKDGTVEKAVRDGILRWHALPFTTHTELMDTTLFSYGVELSKQLDKRFGKQTTGAKMSDVPGHTVGIVPIMKQYGITFLHIGVNPATPLPPVPPLFCWRCEDAEIRVMYQGDYGQDFDLGDTVVVFAHTGDNLGPQNAEQIVKVYAELQEKYPNCEIKVGSISDIAERVNAIEDLPVIEGEIGDTWIHGLGTDPEKVSRFKKVQRQFASLGDSKKDLTDSLLLVPEHTWGLDMKQQFLYDKFYSHEDILRMRKECANAEASWKEQRAYVEAAEKLLGVSSDYPICEPDISEYTEIPFSEEIDFEISWQLYNDEDYERYQRDYMRCFLDWAIWDFTKPGLNFYNGGVFVPKMTHAYKKGNERIYLFEFEEDIKETYGLPRFYLCVDGDRVEVKWFGKKPSRYPQAFWFKMKGFEEKWKIHKMGRWIDPESIIGSPYISGTDFGVKNESYTIESLDCALVAPYGRRLLQYGKIPSRQDLYFNLYNNIWNTNFPMWYSDDAMFRFLIRKS